MLQDLNMSGLKLLINIFCKRCIHLNCMLNQTDVKHMANCSILNKTANILEEQQRSEAAV